MGDFIEIIAPTITGARDGEFSPTAARGVGIVVRFAMVVIRLSDCAAVRVMVEEDVEAAEL